MGRSQAAPGTGASMGGGGPSSSAKVLTTSFSMGDPNLLYTEYRPQATLPRKPRTKKRSGDDASTAAAPSSKRSRARSSSSSLQIIGSMLVGELNLVFPAFSGHPW